MRDEKIREEALAFEKESIFRKELAVPVGILAFAFLTALGALIRIPLPFTPVPVTMQVFFVLLCGALLGPSRGSAAQVLYICLGAAGLPVFTAGAGMARLIGPTGGYIIGFVVAQAVVGLLTDRSGGRTPGIARISAAMLAGVAVIYTFGIAQLMIVTGVDFTKAIAMGALPFIPYDIAKAAFAAAAAAGSWKYIKKAM